MSAFVVSDETMCRAVRALCSMGEYAAIIERVADIQTRRADSATQIGRELFAMNIAAVQARYPDTRANPAGMPGPVNDNGDSIAPELAASFTCVTPQGRLPFEELVSGYKALSCLIYQCSEGDIPETELFKELQRAQAYVGDAIIVQLPQYQAAPWD